MLLRRLFAAVLAPLALLAAALPAGAEVVKTGHIEVELVSQEAAAVPGSTVFVALRQKIQPHWHTYWRNPGDAGDATKIVWTLPTGWIAGDIVWPTPERVRVGPLQDYAYSGEVLLPVPQKLDVPAGTSYITMTSCSPMYSLAERIVAYGVFESFTPRSAGEPASLAVIA